MAEKFYNLEEVVEKLGKTADEVKQMVKDGKLREFRFGSNISYKVEDVDALKTELEESEIDLVLEETGEISLEPNIPDEVKSEGGFNLSNVPDLTGAKTFGEQSRLVGQRIFVFLIATYDVSEEEEDENFV